MRPGTGSASLLRMATPRLASLSPWSRALADQLEPEPFQVGGCHSHHRHCRGPRGRAKRPGRPMRSLGSCRRSPAMRASDRRRTGTLGMLPPSKADSEARQELSRACEDKAPAGSRWSRPGLCRAAGGRGMGGTRPAQVQRSISARVPGLGSISFQRRVMGAKAPLGRLSRRHPAAPPGWSGPARNRPCCRWPGFAPAGRGRGAPDF